MRTETLGVKSNSETLAEIKLLRLRRRWMLVISGGFTGPFMKRWGFY
jgi:hypothetical protein